MMKGKPRASAPTKCIISMQVGEQAYISYSSIIFGKMNIYIELLTPIMHLEECGEHPDRDRVLITRVGKGLYDRDFDVDFTKTEVAFIIATDKQTDMLERESHLYLVIANTGFDIVSEEKTIAKVRRLPSLTTLNRRLERAIAKEDYTLAIRCRDEIKEIVANQRKRT